MHEIKNTNGLEIFSDRDIYPFDNYAERLAYIRSATATVGTLEAECAKPLITLIIGGANTGKSCLFNCLIGEDISPVKEISGYTGDFFIAYDRKVDLGVLEEISADPDKLHKTAQEWMAGKILVDTPDFDSINDYNRKRLEELIPLAHVVVVLVTAAKREIAPLAEILIRYAGRKTFIFVMNKQDREADYSQPFREFLKGCGFADPLLIRASCMSSNEWYQGVKKIEDAIGRVDQERAKTRKYRGDVRDSIELLYNPTEVLNTLNSLKDMSGDFRVAAKKIILSEITSTLSSLARHPKIIRDVILVEVAGRRWLLMSLLLRVWARHRILLALAGAGSLLSRASGSAIPFISGVASGILAQAGEVSTLDSLRDQVRRGLKKNSLFDFFRLKYREMNELLTRHRIRGDLTLPDEPGSITEESKYYLEQAVEDYLGGLIKKSYKFTLVFLEFLVWAGIGGYMFFRAKYLYEHNQITIEAMVFAALISLIILTMISLTGFVLYIGASTRKKLDQKIKETDMELEISCPLQPAIDAIEEFKKSAEKTLSSYGET